MKYTDELTVRVTIEDYKSIFSSASLKKTIEVSSEGENLFTETTLTHKDIYKTRSGIAGAVNLLHQLILNHDDARYLNDDYKLNKELQRTQNIIAYSADIGKQLRFIPKMRFKILNFKMKLFNILFQ